MIILCIVLNFVGILTNISTSIIMNLNEKLEDLNYKSRDEWFEVIKGVCRFQAKRAVCGLTIFLLLFITAWVYFYTSRYQGGKVGDIVAICFDLNICSILACSILAWGIVNNLLFIQSTNRLETPEQLLHQHEKRMKNDRRASLVCMLALIVSLVGPFAVTDLEWPSYLVNWSIKAVLVALILYFYFKGSYLRYSNRDIEITERLQDLINSK